MTQVISIPEPRTSVRTASLTPTTKCFVPEYVAPPAKPTRPAVEAMFTIWPRPRGSIRASASFVPCSTPWTLMSTWRRATSSCSSTNGDSGMIPALLTNTSSGPSASSVASMKRPTDARSQTLSSSAIVPLPSSAAVSRAAAMSRSPIETFIPARTQACAVARPMPRPAPVIAMTRPSSGR